MARLDGEGVGAVGGGAFEPLDTPGPPGGGMEYIGGGVRRSDRCGESAAGVDGPSGGGDGQRQKQANRAEVAPEATLWVPIGLPKLEGD